MVKKFYLENEYDCPEATMKGVFEAATRWRIIADGIADIIRYVPLEERPLVTNLQYAWMQAESQRAKLAAPPPKGLLD